MKFDEHLNPIDDGRDSGNHSGGSVTREPEPGSGGDSQLGKLRFANESSRASGIGNEDGIEDVGDDLPIGVPSGNGKAARSADPSRKRTGSGRGNRGTRSNAGGSGANIASSGSDSSARAEEAALDASAPAPRQVKIESLGRATASDKKLTKQFIAEGYVLFFDTIGYAVRDKETWELERDGDAAELAERTHNWLQSMDRAKSAKWEKLLAKWQPFLMLLMALVAIVGPRIAQTSAKRKNALNLRGTPPKPVGAAAGSGAGTGNATGPVAPTQQNANSVGEQPIIRPRPASDAAPIDATHRPLNRLDFAELYGTRPDLGAG